tara:strand:+ start:348 stop:731 length:384 start_codon:yes stop_codon:yes gene_type:complete
MAFANTGWNPKNASWGCTTETKQLAEGLTSLSTWPSAGEVEDKKNNPAMEKFRKAQNVVYDIFNNGLGNRAYQCRHALDGLTKAELAFATYINGRFCYPANWDQIEEKVEEKFTPIVMAAAREQGLI